MLIENELLNIFQNFIFRTEKTQTSLSSKLETGGKPSTWFPPAELVELSSPKTCQNVSILWKYEFRIIFLWIIFSIIYFLHVFFKFSFSNFEHYFSVTRIFQDHKSILFDTEKFAFMFFMNFKLFEMFWFLSFIVTSGVRVACFLDFSFLLEHFCFKVQASWHHCT